MAASHVLVTGGAGFIGSHTVDRLIAEGHRVTVLDDFSQGSRLNLAAHLGAPELVVVEADVASPLRPVLGEAIERHGPVERIVHLAAQTAVQRSIDDPLHDLRVNAGGTLQVLQLAREQGVRGVVMASSAAVYGDTPVLPVHEGLTPAPLSPYGAHKLVSEGYLRIWAELHGVSTTPLRFFNVYGPRQDPKSPYSGVISLFFDKAFAGAPLTIDGDGLQTRDMVFVTDVVDAILRAVFRDDAVGEPINVGTGRQVTVLELARLVTSFAKSNSVIGFGPARAGSIVHSRAAVDRARDRLGFVAAVPVAAGLERTAAWFAAERASRLA
ncbi:MAG: SDR family NAD(P)-dependent oxidoreductase [Deltaproteobacteria bacterium]|nr:MAG: SDR family NAD(P)-dependent oxidoreductase [Deltaproteobacteria bacterium]